MAEKKFSMGVFIPNFLTNKLELRIVRHFQIKYGRPILNSWRKDKVSYWWKKWKDEKTAKVTAQKIIGEVGQVKAIFIFDYATGKTLHCWIKKSQDFLSTVYCTQEELKKHLEENYQLSFTWKYGELINAEE